MLFAFVVRIYNEKNASIFSFKIRFIIRVILVSFPLVPCSWNFQLVIAKVVAENWATSLCAAPRMAGGGG
jgi:hypothetical protein